MSWVQTQIYSELQEVIMGEDVSNISDNSRTNWSRCMDNYFIELLLDQVHKGNKTDNAFGKEAWAEMIALFNGKFGFRHETDVLKNRYKWLRKQFNNIKILIQNGFSWDEKRNMVTAENHVWDDYIKDHPEMQPYRTKVVPYYKELCIICGHAVADGRYSLSCFDVGYENEAKVLDDRASAKDDRTKIDWSQKMDEYFIQLMIEEVHKGNKLGRTFKNKAWIYMSSQFNKKFGCQHGKVVLKNRYNVLKRQCSTVKFLLGQKGFSWDEKQHMLIAEDHVWSKVIKAHRNFQKYRNKTLLCYVDMCVICGNETTLATQDIASQNLRPENSVGAAMSEGCKEISDSGRDKNLSNQQKKRKVELQQTLQLSKKAHKVDEGVENAMQEMAVAVTTLTKKNKNNGNCISTKNVINALQAIPEMDEDLLLDACDFLEDERKARMFLALDETLRRKWLTRKLRP